MDIATVLNSLNAKVRTLSARDNAGTAFTTITLEIKNLAELKYVMSRLAAVPGVSEVMRNGN
jgi:(p)ppGpp synthase/HD superfamily hydrolase